MATPTNGPPKAVPPPVTKRVQETLLAKKADIEKLCSRWLTADQLFKISLNCIAKTPKLLECTASSLVQSIITFAEWGLHPNPQTGLCYLVPYRDNKSGTVTATPMLGYRGMIELARRSGQVIDVEARIVREGEPFICKFGFMPQLEHHPGWDSEGEVVGVYAIARLKEGSPHVELMSPEQVERIRARSKSANDGPWKNDWEEMAKKTVVRRMMKYLPLTGELADALEKEGEVVEGAVTSRGGGGNILTPTFTQAPPAARRPELPEDSHQQTVESSARPEPVPVVDDQEELEVVELLPETDLRKPQMGFTPVTIPPPVLGPSLDLTKAPTEIADQLIGYLRAASSRKQLQGLNALTEKVPTQVEQQRVAKVYLECSTTLRAKEQAPR